MVSTTASKEIFLVSYKNLDKLTAEIARIAAFLGEDEEAFIAAETELSPDRKGLILKSRADGSCVYLTEDNRCRIHPVKPDKCRTFPYEWTNPDSHHICPGLRACTSDPDGMV